MRLTLIASPLEAFVTSIFFDQLPDFKRMESLENKQKRTCWKPKLPVRFSAYTKIWFHIHMFLVYINLFIASREFLLKDDTVLRVSDEERDIMVIGSSSLGQQLFLVF